MGKLTYTPEECRLAIDKIVDKFPYMGGDVAEELSALSWLVMKYEDSECE